MLWIASPRVQDLPLRETGFARTLLPEGLFPGISSPGSVRLAIRKLARLVTESRLAFIDESAINIPGGQTGSYVPCFMRRFPDRCIKALGEVV